MKYYGKKRGKKSIKVPKKVKKYVKGIMDRQVEDKYYQAFGSFNIATSDATIGSSVYLTPVQQGDGVNNRIGQKIRVKSIKLNCNIASTGLSTLWDPTGSNHAAQIRWALTQYKMQTGKILCTTPNDSAFVSGTANSIFTNGAAGVVIQNQRLITGLQSMTVLKQNSRYIDVHGGATNLPQNVKLTIIKKFKKPILVQYTGNTTAASSCLKNGLWFNIMGAFPTDVVTTLSYGYTLTYEDA